MALLLLLLLLLSRRVATILVDNLIGAATLCSQVSRRRHAEPNMRLPSAGCPFDFGR
jgi:hypothetical protein